MVLNGEGRTCQNRLALLPEMRRQNANTDPAAYRAGGLSPVLSEVQIRLCGSLSQQNIGRNQTARRLDAVQSRKPVCTAFSFLRVGQPEYQSIMKNSALVVIDLQNDITKNYREIIENVNEAID